MDTLRTTALRRKASCRRRLPNLKLPGISPRERGRALGCRSKGGRSDRARKKLINESQPPSEITGSRFDVLASSENSLQTLGEGQEGDSRGVRQISYVIPGTTKASPREPKVKDDKRQKSCSTQIKPPIQLSQGLVQPTQDRRVYHEEGLASPPMRTRLGSISTGKEKVRSPSLDQEKHSAVVVQSARLA